MYAQNQESIVDAPPVAIENGEYLMIDEISLRNFRGFKHIEVPGLKRVNLLVGKNSSGKSAFMESVFLASGSLAPNVVFQMRQIRRMGNQLVLPTDIAGHRGLWEDLFYEFKPERASIKISGNPNSDSRSLSIEFISAPGTQELPFGKQPLSGVSSGVAQGGSLPEIQFTWKRQNHQTIVIRPKITASGLQFDAKSMEFFPCIWFAPGVGETPQENAQRFSNLDTVGQIDTIVSVLHKEFPFIEDLSIGFHAGVPMVFASTSGNSRKMPVPLISDGVNRLLGICLGIANTKGGTILIDQLEDGFHHKLLPSIWNSIYKLAVVHNVQLFVSTHSAECLSAMRPVLKGNEEDFSLLRCSRMERGCTIDVLPGTYLETALEQDFEVR
jgi:AAA domain, putative AbiEii toxin, Type IV TA system